MRAKIEEKLNNWAQLVGIVPQLVEPTLFLEVMAERGGETHVFLPFAKEKFIQTSVNREGSDWVKRFEKVLDDATSVHYVTNEGYYGDDSLFTFCNDVMLGFASMRGRGLDEDPNLLLFWDGSPGEEGGTGEVADSWRKTFNEPEVICANEVLELLDQMDQPPIPTGNTKPSSWKVLVVCGFVRSVKTMLCADVEAFAKVDEDKTIEFLEVFHGNVSRIMQELGCVPEFLNSWETVFLRFLMT